MTRILIYTFILALLCCSTMNLLAYNDKAKKTVNKNWAGCLAEDTDGPLSAEAKIEVNIEYPGEPGIRNGIQNFFRGYGVEYHAYAKVKGEAPNDDYEGEYDLYASVCFDDDEKNNTWRRKVDEKVRADDFVKLSEELTDWDSIKPNDELYPWADADVDGASPEIVAWKWVGIPCGESGSETRYVRVRDWNRSRPPLSHNAVADVWHFSISDTRNNLDEEDEWNCWKSGNSDHLNDAPCAWCWYGD